MSAKHGKRHLIDWQLRGTTTFYPLYLDGKGDKVQPIESTRPTMFQEVIPRYRLSATQTRDDGVGPMFEEVAYRPFQPAPRKISLAPAASITPPAAQLKRHKIRINFSM